MFILSFLSVVFNFVNMVIGVTYVDLSYSIGFKNPIWPTVTKLERHKELSETSTKKGEWMASAYFTVSEHTSTHMDAPFHIFPGTWKLNDIPLKRMMDIPGIVIDMSWKITKTTPVKRNYLIVKEDILEWERKNEKIPNGTVVLVRTGWGEKFLSDPVDYLGASPECCSFPGLGLTAAKVFAERRVYGVGVDVVSGDFGQTNIFPVHTYLGSRRIFILENVANLHILPNSGFNVSIFPLHIEGGSGSPTRIFATI